MNTAEYLIKELEKFGITDYFGISGKYNANIIKCIESNSNTNWISCTNGLNAGYAADGYARQKGFGALVTTYGSAELSAANAIAGSFAENIPVIHIIGIPHSEEHKNKMPFDFKEIHKHVSQAVTFLDKANIKIELERILKIFFKERKPVCIAIPEDIALLEITTKDIDYDWISDSDTLQKAVELVADRLNKASNPIFIAGSLIKRYNAESEFTDLAVKSGIPITNYMAESSIFSINTDNYLGTYLSKYGNSKIKDYLEKSDCVLEIGAVCGDISLFGVTLPFNADFRISICGTHTFINGKKYDNIKMADILKGIAEKVGYKNIRIDKSEEFYDSLHQTEDKLTSDYIYPRLQKFFKEGDLIYADTGTVTYGLAPVKLPENCELNHQLLQNSAGWATPASFGAGIAKPNSKIILITGDYAHQISAMEIGNLLKYGIKPTVIVINNNGAVLEKFITGDINAEYHNTVQPDFTKLARSFKGDIWATRVETADDFDKALRVTQIMNKLCYIETIISETDLPKIANEIFSHVGRSFNHKKCDNTKQKKAKENEISKISSNKKYRTSVHTSLKDYDGE